MDRNEILKKARAGNTGMDEREQQALGVSFGFGAVLMVCCASRFRLAAGERPGRL